MKRMFFLWVLLVLNGCAGINTRPEWLGKSPESERFYFFLGVSSLNGDLFKAAKESREQAYYDMINFVCIEKNEGDMEAVKNHLLENEELKYSFKLVREHIIHENIDSKRYYRIYDLFRIRKKLLDRLLVRFSGENSDALALETIKERAQKNLAKQVEMRSK